MHLEKAHKLSPQKQTIGFNLILAYINAGQYDKAVSLAKETYDLAPEYKESALNYALAVLVSGRQDLSDKILMDNFGTTIVYDENLLNVYINRGQYERIIPILQKQVNAVGDDPQMQIRLASAYLDSGKPDLAIEEIQKVMAKHEDFRAQGQGYIDAIRAGKTP